MERKTIRKHDQIGVYESPNRDFRLVPGKQIPQLPDGLSANEHNTIVTPYGSVHFQPNDGKAIPDNLRLTDIMSTDRSGEKPAKRQVRFDPTAPPSKPSKN